MEKKEFFEEKQFNDVAYAQDILASSNAKLEKQKFALIIAAAATALNLGGFALGDGFLAFAMLFAGIVGAIIAYIIGGGFRSAIACAFKIGKFGWFILPFPYDLVTGICCFSFAVFGFFLTPVVFVFVNYRQLKKDRDEAQTYIDYCR